MAIATASAPAPTRTGSPAWQGFLATIDNQIKSFYREPAALSFTLLQPLLLLLILNAFNFHVRLPNGAVRPYLDRLLPGLMAFNGMTVGLNSVAFALSRYKERGTLRRIRATPLPTGSFIGGVIVSRLVMTLLVTLITYASGVWLFGAKMVGNAWAMFALTLLGGAIFIAAGLLQVALARSEDDIPPMFMIILMPSLLFSGAFLDRSGLPRLAALDHERPAAHLPHRRGAEGRQPRRGLRVGARRYRRPAHLGRAAYRALHLALQDGLARPAPLLH